MHNVLFDTNIFLSLVIPHDIWKSLITNLLMEMKDYKKQSKVVFLITDLIMREISGKAFQVSKFINDQIRIIYNNLDDTDKPIDKKKIQEIELEFQKRILAQQNPRTRIRNRNLIVFVEEFILNELNENSSQSIDEIFQKSIQFFSSFDTTMVTMTNNFVVENGINQINFPKEKDTKALIRKIGKSLNLKNYSDQRILSFFIYYLQQQKESGLFITFDFGDLLSRSKQINEKYPDVLITRPSYIKCYLD